MAVEYDVVVIGGSTAGVCAAVTAAHLKARVALVEPQPHEVDWLRREGTYSKALSQVGRLAQQMRDAHQFGIHWKSTDAIEDESQNAKGKRQILNSDFGFWSLNFGLPLPSVQKDEAMRWAKGVVSTLEEQHSPAILASLGVDFMTGVGEFCRQPYLAFVVNGRYLRGRAYLIATGSRPVVPDIDGLEATGYLTPADIWQQDLTKRLSSTWVIVGGNPSAIELAQTLARLGGEVTLVVSRPHILVKEDIEAAQLVQAQLEAEGIRVLAQTEVTQVKQIDGKKWVQAGNKAIEADEILLAADYQPNVESLNLAGVGVKFHQHGIDVNEKLQTTNRRIYACKNVFDGYQLTNIADYEARIALKNALFLPVLKVDYCGIPIGVFSDPMLARVGVTETEARHRYGNDVLVLRQYFKTVTKAQLIGETTGLCKIIVRPSGEILGATIVGTEAGELIHALALAIRQKLKVGAIADLPPISPTFSEITYQAAAEWHRQRLLRNSRLSDFLEGLFHWRRSWSK